MEREKEIRLLKAEEIDVRVGGIYPTGITLLLYKDARVDMNVLDETFGPMNWQRKHFMHNDAMFCEVMVKDTKTGEWISKSDVGAPSFSEPVKGAASDAFKRACTNIGIGRELYTAPFIWVPLTNLNVKEESNGKKTIKDKFSVQTITYDENKRTIEGIVIVNQDGKVVFQHMKLGEKKPVKATISDEQITQFLSEISRTGLSLASVLKKHKLTKVSDMDIELWKSAMNTMRKLPDKEIAA